MAFFNIKERRYAPQPIPPTPPYDPPTPPTPPIPEGGSTPDIPRPSFSGELSCTLYVNDSDTNVVSKSIRSVFSCTINVKGNVDIVNPIIIIDSDDDITGCNYMRLGNYYYYASITLLTGNLYQINAHMDGLMSADIRSCIANVNRSASKYNKYINDSIPQASYEEVKTLQFSGGFNKSMQYLLVTIGGGTNA